MQETVKIDRDHYLGGSDVSTIMEINPFKSRYDLLLEKAGYKEDTFEGNIFTEYGNKMEGKIRDWLNEDSGEKFIEGKHILEIPHGWQDQETGLEIRCHTDGEVTDTILEIKTTSQIHDSLEDYQAYLVQLLFYMYVTEKEFGILAVYERPDDLSEELDPDRLQLYHVCLHDHPELIVRMKQAIHRFLVDLVKVKENPFITEEELLPSDITEIASSIIAFEEQLELMKRIEKKVKSEKERLKDAMVHAGVKKWETPSGFKITLIPDQEDKTVEETFFNAERFMLEHPELVEQYMETKNVIKKGKTGYVRITAPKGGDA